MTKFGILCDKFLEACWLAAVVLSPLYMNIYTHRMFEPDKGTIIRSLALLMIVFYIIKVLETAKISTPSTAPTGKPGKQKAVVEATEPASSARKSYIFFPFLAFITLYAISVAFSAVPHNSLWGGYDRMQGLYTNASFWMVFILTAINIKTREQVERLISTIIFTSVPIVAYCFIQRLRLDPVPWQQMDPSIRVSATMGNPIFLSAYLILTIPLTLSRFVRGLYDRNLTAYIFYGLLAVLQVITVFLSQSRGPMLGMLGSIFLFVLIYAWAYRKKLALRIIIACSVAGAVFMGFFNLPHIIIALSKKPAPDVFGSVNYNNKGKTVITWSDVKDQNKKVIKQDDVPQWWHNTFGQLMKIPYFRQLGKVLEIQPGSSGRTRIILWNGVWKLINDKDERSRFFIGWGPESLSTVYYKNYTMELAALEGANVHADRTHNHYLDVWVMHGIFGLIAYLSLLAAIFYTVYKVIRSIIGSGSPQTGPPSSDTLVMIGLITALAAHLAEIFVGIAIVSTYTHFWVITAAIYAVYRLNLLAPETGKPENSPLNTESGLHWGVYLLLGYAVLTIVIAFILFKFTWTESRMITQEIKTTRDAFLATFCIWLLAGVIVGIVAWPRYLFWTYAGQTVMMAVIMVRRYWPDDTSNTDLLMIYSWLWIAAGILVGALSLPRKEKPVRFWTFSNVLVGLVIFTTILFIVANKNLSVLRADGFYKFCFSYDQSAEEAARQGKKDEAFQIRLECIRFFQNALKFAPDERAYLNGAGRNFLELAKLSIVRDQERNSTIPNKLRMPPTIKELTERDIVKGERMRSHSDFSSRDFAICSFACIQRAYELDPKNYERIIALIRIYRYLADIDHDKTFIERAIKLCDEARKASPLNTKTDEELRELQQRIKAYSAPPPPEQKPK